MNHVPYKSISAITQDMQGGMINIGFMDVASAMPLVKQGRLKVLGLTGSLRSPGLPAAPLMSEQGIDFTTDGWYGVFAPKGTPAPVVALAQPGSQPPAGIAGAARAPAATQHRQCAGQVAGGVREDGEGRPEGVGADCTQREHQARRLTSPALVRCEHRPVGQCSNRSLEPETRMLSKELSQIPRARHAADGRADGRALWSNGVALDGDIYRPKDLGGDRRVPAVVLSHGWGGSKSSGERYAAKFAAAGMVSLCFTHGGWASSGQQGRAGRRSTRSSTRTNEGIAKVRFIRELLDPLEWIQNYRCAVDYIEGEPNVDPNRIGAWGTSFGGGVAHAQRRKRRSQSRRSRCRSHRSRFATARWRVRGKQRAIDIARGTIASVPQGHRWRPVSAACRHAASGALLAVQRDRGVRKLKVPTLMLDAGNEELFDIKENSGKAYEILKSQDAAPGRYKVIDGIDHYGIYFDGFEEGSEAALEWFGKHL